MLGEVLVAQDPTAIAHGDDLLSIREMPGETTGKLTMSACAELVFILLLSSCSSYLTYASRKLEESRFQDERRLF